ncbi:unnamed protein product [Echinostoma caproni]|uniref:Dynein regulatory complex subunit 3 n=1 Tax=Echinostoma caproni TaxID=27848 RepID=A0A182ZZY1_9TREM|nr:unnamed protein product [Echinostoma caproni]
MTRVYDTVEPAVIDRAMLQNAVFAQGPQGVAGTYAKKEGVQFATVTSLRLDFQSKNLSFNNIEKIEGLDKLENIEDLTLYNNRIAQIENMENLKKLQLIYLRRFPSLQSVCLRGNPFCEEPDYGYFLHAFLPQLLYVDYKRTKEDVKKAAYEKYQLRVDQLNAQEQGEKEQQANEEVLKLTEALHQRAFVAGLDSETIFDTLYIEDPDGFKQQCKAVFDVGLQELEKRDAEVKCFWDCVERAKKINGQCGQKMIDEFKLYQAEVR